MGTTSRSRTAVGACAAQDVLRAWWESLERSCAAIDYDGAGEDDSERREVAVGGTSGSERHRLPSSTNDGVRARPGARAVPGALVRSQRSRLSTRSPREEPHSPRSRSHPPCTASLDLHIAKFQRVELNKLRRRVFPHDHSHQSASALVCTVGLSATLASPPETVDRRSSPSPSRTPYAHQGTDSKLGIAHARA